MMVFIESENMGLSNDLITTGLNINDGLLGVHRIMGNYILNFDTAIHFSVYALIGYSYVVSFTHFMVRLGSALITKCQEWMPFIFITTAILITIVSVIMIRDDAIERDQMISDLADKSDQIFELKNKLNKHSLKLVPVNRDAAVKLVPVKLVPVKLVPSCNYKQDLVEEESSQEYSEEEEEEYDSEEEEEEYDSEEEEEEYDSEEESSQEYSEEEEEEYDSEEEEYDSEEEEEEEYEDPNDSDYDPEEDDF
jgi:flagellar biosynthesis GTPase FlhF